jgi:hypothetical protein
MERTIKQWLGDGDTAPFRFEEGGYHSAIAKVTASSTPGFTTKWTVGYTTRNMKSSRYV